MKKIVCVLMMCLVAFLIWATTFLFIVNPIGAVPEGKTVWMFKPDRLFTQEVIPFICSADGILLKKMGGVSLLGRGITMSAIINNGDIIAKFPYSRSLYLLSTDGIEFSK